MKRKRYFDELDTISIERFVHSYLEVDKSVDCSNLKHIGLKSFENPFVIGVSNDFALKNIDLVKEGKLVLVVDCKNSLGTYLNPFHLRDLLDKEKLMNMKTLLLKTRIYELSEILKHYSQLRDVDDALLRLNDYELFLESVGKKENIEHMKVFKRKSEEFLQRR